MFLSNVTFDGNYFCRDYLFEVLLFPDNVEALARENVLPHSIHGQGTSLWPHQHKNLLDPRETPEELFEDDLADESSTASEKDCFSLIEFSDHYAVFLLFNYIERM